MVRKILLICGVLAALLYVGSDIVAALRWEGYSYTAQSVSELRAIGAPTRPFLLPVLFLYALCESAFGVGIWRVAGPNRSLRIAGGLLLALGAVDLLVAPFFPMHLRGAEGTSTDTMHIILTTLTVLLILLIIGFGAAADGRWFRVYSIATLLILIVTGVWAFLGAPQIAANQPTPWLGIRERINIYGYMLWLAVLALVLLRAPMTTVHPHTRDRGDASRPTSHLTPA